MPSDYNGTWDMVNDNLEGYMAALDINFATCKIVSMQKPQEVIKQDRDSFTFQTISPVLKYECSFKIGEEFEEVTKTMDHRKCQSVVNWDNDKLVCSERREAKQGLDTLDSGGRASSGSKSSKGRHNPAFVRRRDTLYVFS